MSSNTELKMSGDELTELVASFQDGTIHTCEFSHPEHLYVIWSLVKSLGTLPAISRFETCLKEITKDEPEKYHATVTHALGITMGERVAANPDASWDEFVAANADLFEWPNAMLDALYPNGELGTPEAKATFILPPA